MNLATKPRSKRRKCLSAGRVRIGATTRCRVPRGIGQSHLMHVERIRILIEADVYLTTERLDLAVLRMIDREARRWSPTG